MAHFLYLVISLTVIFYFKKGKHKPPPLNTPLLVIFASDAATCYWHYRAERPFHWLVEESRILSGKCCESEKIANWGDFVANCWYKLSVDESVATRCVLRTLSAPECIWGLGYALDPTEGVNIVPQTSSCPNVRCPACRGRLIIFLCAKIGLSTSSISHFIWLSFVC